MHALRTVLAGLPLLLAFACAEPAAAPAEDAWAHGGGLNRCGCHFNRKTRECHCHRGCGCACEPPRCGHSNGVQPAGEGELALCTPDQE